MSKKTIVYVDPDLSELIPDFISNRHKDIQSITASLEKGDMETVRILGHSMKGSGSGYGFDRISEIGGALEKAAQAENDEEIRKWVDELASYMDRVEVVYE